MIIVRPKTQTISVNNKCDLMCEHCKGQFLGGMQGEINEDVNSYLISGGCDSQGGIDFDFDMLEDMKKQGKKINIHSGLVDEETAKKIGHVADCVSFDMITDNKIIKEIYHLKKTEDDFIKSFELLKKYCRVVPHVLIGLGNEKRSIDKLRALGETEVAFIILMKHPQIKNDLKESSVEYIEKILKYGRKFEFVRLGCMRPMARKKEIDQMAIKYIDSIVNPHKDVDFGDMDLVEKDMCCTL